MTVVWVILVILLAALVSIGVGWIAFVYFLTKVFDDWFV